MLNIKPISNDDPHVPMKCPYCGTIFDMFGIEKIACLECTKILDIKDMIKTEKTTDNNETGRVNRMTIEAIIEASKEQREINKLEKTYKL